MTWTETPDAPRWRRPAATSIGTRSDTRPLGVGASGAIDSSPAKKGPV